jgi:hypothetical protein
MKTIIKEKVTLESIARLITQSIAGLATKKELADMATSISKLATKEEISKLATKEDLNIAIDNLAGAVKKGFDEVHEKFAKVNENFIKVGKRFDILERKVERIDTKFTNQLDYISVHYAMHSELMVLDTRMKKVEERLKI